MICYHGTTDKVAYETILKEGVKKGSWWTPFLPAALTMGGPYIIAVFFPEIDEKWLGKSEGNWQFISRRTIKQKDFIATLKYSAKLLTYWHEANTKMRKFFAKKDGKKWCNFCNGHGELTYKDNGHHWLIGGSRFDSKVYKGSRTGKMQLCPKCLGGALDTPKGKGK